MIISIKTIYNHSLLKTDALHSAINFLSRREHSSAELVDKLQLKGFILDDIDPVIFYLQENNYQSDQRYAECIIRNRVKKGYGWQYIKQALQLKGVCENIIVQEGKNQQIDWYLQAEIAYNKRYSNRPITDLKDKAKRIRFMQNRGFSSDQIFTLVNNELN